MPSTILYTFFMFILVVVSKGDLCPDFCNEEPPPPGPVTANLDTYTCQEQKDFGQCGAEFMKGYCECTCGTCNEELDAFGAIEDVLVPSLESPSSKNEFQRKSSGGEPERPLFFTQDKFVAPSIERSSSISSSVLGGVGSSPILLTQGISCGALFAQSRQLSLEESYNLFGYQQVEDCLNSVADDCGYEVESGCCQSGEYPLLCQCSFRGSCQNKLDKFTSIPGIGLFVYLDDQNNKCKCPFE